MQVRAHSLELLQVLGHPQELVLGHPLEQVLGHPLELVQGHSLELVAGPFPGAGAGARASWPDIPSLNCFASSTLTQSSLNGAQSHRHVEMFTCESG